MVKSKVKKEEIDERVRKIDSMDRVSLLNAFMQEHPEAKRKLANKRTLEKRIKNGKGYVELSELLNSVAETTYLQKPKPIAGQLSIFEHIQRWLAQFESAISSNTEAFKEYVSQVPQFSEVMLNFCTITSIVEVALWGIRNKTGNIIHVNFAHPKALLTKEFGELLDEELPKSPAYRERIRTREQDKERLRIYLKVWKLRDLGLSYEDIALRLYGSLKKKETVRRQFYKAFEIIYGTKYDRQKYRKTKALGMDQSPCKICEDWDTCSEECPKMIEIMRHVEVSLREKLIGEVIDRLTF